MTWHRLVHIPRRENVVFHYLVESHENAGISSTIGREGEALVIQCTTTLSAAPFFDRVIDRILEEMERRRRRI